MSRRERLFEACPLGMWAIYVLYLQLDRDGQGPKLYYVGKAKDPDQRFRHHDQIRWHQAKFDCWPEIRVLGYVAENRIDEAEQALTRLATRHGYEMINQVYNPLYSSVRWTTPKVEAYFDEPQRDEAFIDAWRLKYRVQSPSISADDAGEDDGDEDYQVGFGAMAHAQRPRIPEIWE